MRGEEQAGPLGSEKQVAYRNWTVSGWVLLVTALLGVAVLTAVVLLNFRRGHRSGPLSLCKSNMKNLAIALEMYASDNAGNYPHSLDKLIDPSYLHKIPTCPAAGKVTYLDYRVSTEPDSFSFSCCGDNHKGAYTAFQADSTGFPRYNAELGLIDHPPW